jgi:hypothetical protein
VTDPSLRVIDEIAAHKPIQRAGCEARQHLCPPQRLCVTAARSGAASFFRLARPLDAWFAGLELGEQPFRFICREHAADLARRQSSLVRRTKTHAAPANELSPGPPTMRCSRRRTARRSGLDWRVHSNRFRPACRPAASKRRWRECRPTQPRCPNMCRADQNCRRVRHPFGPQSIAPNTVRKFMKLFRFLPRRSSAGSWRHQDDTIPAL